MQQKEKNYIIKKITTVFKKNIKWIIFTSLIIISLLIIKDLYYSQNNRLDYYSYKYISMLISSKFTLFFKFITKLASFPVVTILSLLALFIYKNKRHPKLLIINLIFTALLTQVLKTLFNRSRPSEFILINENGFSFPSGHSMVSMAFYGYIIYILWKNLKNKYLKYISISILSFLIPLIGISRIYLGVHYATDVLAGFCISLSYLIVFISITNAVNQRRDKK